MRINLLPPHLRQEQERFPWGAALCIFVLCWLCTFLQVSGWSQVQQRQRQIAQVQEATRQAEENVEQLKQAKKELESLQLEFDSWQSESKESRILIELLAQLRWRVPQNLWFDKLEVAEDGQLTLTGGALSLASVSRFLAELELFPLIESVALKSTEKKEDYYSFKLQGKLNKQERGGESET